MNPLLRSVYSGITRLAQKLAERAGESELADSSLAPRSAKAQSSKLRRALSARRGLLEHWERQSKVSRDPARPLVWLHAPSVGEGLQARPVAQQLRHLRPDIQLAYSWFSPSAERFGRGMGADLCGYLPFDSHEAAERMLDALSPALLVFAKLDVWPVLVERVRARGVPVALISGTIAPASGRRGRLARAVLSDAYRSLSAVGAIDSANAERLEELGVKRDVVSVTGDTRFDQVWLRAQTFSTQLPALAGLANGRLTLIAGSTWPSDEAVLLPVWEQVVRQLPGTRLIIAPHEPTPEHVGAIIKWAKQAGLACELYSSQVDADVIAVDRLGVLGELYGLGSVAFVGGGFHRAGLHSVIEPAAYGLPVMFGPGHQMSREAGLLLAVGGARSGDRAVIEAAALDWLGSQEQRERAGASARNVVISELGATERSVNLLMALLPGVGAQIRRS